MSAASVPDSPTAPAFAGETATSLLVLGAGYVGAEVVRRAIARGWRVAALTRNAGKAAQLRAAGCALVIEADLATDAWHAPATAAGPFAAVVNCVSSAGGGIDGYRRSYLDGTASLARLLATQPHGGSVAYTSSTGVYPQGGGARVDETAPTEGASETGRVLREAERALAAGAAAAGWRWFVLRLAGIYGPGRHGVLDQLRAGATSLGGDPAHRMNLIHRDDAAAALLAALSAPATVGSDVFNLSDGAPATRAEFAAWIARRIGAPVPTFDPAASPRGGASPFGARAPAPDRVIVAERVRRVFGWAPAFPDFRAGYEALLAAPPR